MMVFLVAMAVTFTALVVWAVREARGMWAFE